MIVLAKRLWKAKVRDQPCWRKQDSVLNSWVCSIGVMKKAKFRSFFISRASGHLSFFPLLPFCPQVGDNSLYLNKGNSLPNWILLCLHSSHLGDSSGRGGSRSHHIQQDVGEKRVLCTGLSPAKDGGLEKHNNSPKGHSGNTPRIKRRIRLSDSNPSQKAPDTQAKGPKTSWI